MKLLLIMLLTLTILVIVHEFGHYLMARYLNIKVLRFSLGFGKPLFRWQNKHGTEFVIAWCLLGGYIKMLDEREMTVATIDLPYAFNRQSLAKRAAVIFSGPAINILFAGVIYYLIFLVGITQPIPLINNVLPNSIAAHAKLPAGSEIIAINDQKISNWREAVVILLQQYQKNNQLAFTLALPGAIPQRYSLVTSKWQMDDLHPDLLSSLGLQACQPLETTTAQPHWPANKLRLHKASLWHAWQPAINEVLTVSKINLLVIEKLFTGYLSFKSLGGPLTFIQGTGTALNGGLISYLDFLALLSLTLAIFNLMPIPGLDGAQLAYLAYEKIRGKPLSVAMQVLLFKLGIMALTILMIQTGVNDISRL